MSKLYKIGLNNLPKRDVNSAVFEYNLINSIIQELYLPDTIIILGGKFSNDDAKLFDELNNYKYKIFIATDTISITTCKDIINICDILLHQCPYGNIEGINIKQKYSYIPELFYTDRPKIDKSDSLVFAGSFRDVKSTILDYTSKINSKLIIKTETCDNRLEYSDYLNELDKHKYGLVLLRKSNHIPGWITSRFVEYISCNVFPIVHYDYDEYNYFESIKTLNGDDAKILIDGLNKMECVRQGYVNAYKRRFRNDKYKFINVISKTWEELYEQTERT